MEYIDLEDEGGWQPSGDYPCLCSVQREISYLIKEELDFIRSEEFAKERAKHMLNKAILNLDWDEQ
jgi:hypothetical protein